MCKVIVKKKKKTNIENAGEKKIILIMTRALLPHKFTCIFEALLIRLNTCDNIILLTIK